MGLLRARVDAVLIGARTLWDDRTHLWTAAAICAEDAALFARVRVAEGRREPPWCVVATRSGELPPDARVLAGAEQPVLVATTDAGAARMADAPWRAHVEVLALGDDVTPQGILDALGRRGCTRVLSEAGPGLYVPLLAAGIGHELYLTLCPVLVGGDGRGALSLAHGAGFGPDTAPRPAIRSVRSGAGQVYLRVRVHDT
jgi:riboflavin biosynthesis pyrimidine reductase